MTFRRTRAQSVDSPTPEQSRTIQDLTALIRDQNTQIQCLIDLQNPQPRKILINPSRNDF